MILVQSILLKVALDNRPPTGMRAGLQHMPFSAYSHEGFIQQILSGKRPYQFWQWPTSGPYVVGFFSTSATFNVLIAPLGYADTTSSFFTSSYASPPSTSSYESLRFPNHRRILPSSAMSVSPLKPPFLSHKYSRIIKLDHVKGSDCR